MIDDIGRLRFQSFINEKLLKQLNESLPNAYLSLSLSLSLF